MEAPAISQRIDREVDTLDHPGDFDIQLAPVILKLLAWRGLETDRGTALPQWTLGLDVVTRDADPTLVASSLDLSQNDCAISDYVTQQLIDLLLLWIQEALA